jgi:radical S-adenosyl methionine domain-containing protein 2
MRPINLFFAGIAVIAAGIGWFLKRTKKVIKEEEKKKDKKDERVAVNYHITRECNYECKFCFHTAKTSHVESTENAKKIVLQLRQGGFRKINFAGGEPFLQPKLLGILCQYAKVECKFESVSIISNGSKIKEDWFRKHGKYVDILGISCDSFNETVNVQIGRGKGNHLSFVKEAARLCKVYNIQFKLNTVVNKYNFQENMSQYINELNPSRWKVFQVLALQGENIGEGAKRNVNELLIENDQFDSFIRMNLAGLHHKEILKIEGNDVMQTSYVLVDEYGCFLDCSRGGKTATKSILEVGVDVAWEQLLGKEGIGYNSQAFYARDGDYKTGCWSTVKDIEDFGK